MGVEKAVILAAGTGSRMREDAPGPELREDQRRAAAAGHKGLMPFDRPFLDYVLAALEEAGIAEICLVVGPASDDLRRYAQRRRPRRPRLGLAVQPAPRGTADALACAASWTGNAPFLVLNSDTYYPASGLAALAALDTPGLLAVERGAARVDPRSNLSIDRMASFAVLDLDAQGFIVALEEKPARERYDRRPDPLWLSVNGWRFEPSIHRHCAALAPSPRGELELPAAAMAAIRAGERIRMVPISGVLDLSTRSDVGAVETLLREASADG